MSNHDICTVPTINAVFGHEAKKTYKYSAGTFLPITMYASGVCALPTIHHGPGSLQPELPENVYSFE